MLSDLRICQRASCPSFGGVKRRVTPGTELRADIRYIVIRDISDDVTDLWRVTGGLTVNMGR